MEDLQLWKLGAVRLKTLLSELSSEAVSALQRQLARYLEAKVAYAAVAAEVNAACLCQECGGECCMNGKYRLNVLDAAALIVADVSVPAAFKQKPLCPYGTESGCSMESALRPADCVLFVCDAIDRKLSEQDRIKLAELERVVRDCINTASQLLGEPLGTPLLLWVANKR